MPDLASPYGSAPRWTKGVSRRVVPIDAGYGATWIFGKSWWRLSWPIE